MITKKHNAYVGLWDLTIVGADGRIKDQQLGLRNGLSDDGEALILSCFFQNNVTLTQFNARLCTITVDPTKHYSDVSPYEISGTGITPQYPAPFSQNLTGWTAQHNATSGNWTLTSSQQSFNFHTGVTFASLLLTAPITFGTALTGWSGGVPPTESLVAFLNLTSPRTVSADDTLLVQVNVTLQ